MIAEIMLVERGPPELVPLSVWRQTALEEPMNIIASRGVVRLTRTVGGVLITPGHHVGEMILTSAVVRIQPKSAGLLSAMERLALRARAKTALDFRERSRRSVGDDSDPAGRFSKALAQCVREGIPWRYGTRTSVTSFPRGQIRIGETIRRLASRGIRHRVVSSIPMHVQERQFVQVLREAIRSLPLVPGVSRKLLADVELLESTLDHAPPFPSLDGALQAAQEVANRIDPRASPFASELAICCIEIISREYATAGSVEYVPGGVARFQDLEELWERCTQLLVETWLRTAGVPGLPMLHPLRGSQTRLFEDGGPKLDPDLVVLEGRNALAVFDAKYKALDRGTSGAASDLYQLTAYVRRLSARVGALVHFAYEQDQVLLVGTTPEGAQVAAFSISPKLLISYGENALTRLLSDWPAERERLAQSLANGLRHERGDSIPDLPGNIFLGAQENKVIGKGL